MAMGGAQLIELANKTTFFCECSSSEIYYTLTTHPTLFDWNFWIIECSGCRECVADNSDHYTPIINIKQ